MPQKIKSVRGVSDLLPSEIGIWQWIEETARSMFEAFGYKEIRTPLFEQADLFTRSIGEETDIVSKEMYTFPDRKGQLLSLRPEGTAPVVRAYLQHNLQLDPQGHKLYYMGPMFRYERPQAGRARQFHQIGAECFGPSEPEADAEQIILTCHLLKKLWTERNGSAVNKKDVTPFKIHLNTLGCRSCRADFHRLLKERISNIVPMLCEDCRKRYNSNILRVLDCKNPDCKGLLKDAPSMMDNLCTGCEDHFEAVKGLLNEAEISYVLDPHLVRGLDYYTRTTFEFTSHLLGAQNAVAGGGRYDLLVEDFGGPPTPACGFALGMERLILALSETSQKEEILSPYCFCFMAHIGSDAQKSAFNLVNRIRLMGVPVEMNYQASSLKSKMKQADRLRAVYTLILGEDEISKGCIILRQMKTGEQEEYPMEQIPQVLYKKYSSWVQENKNVYLLKNRVVLE
ncbi:MAG: histidine--tRNA ligase [bacterium]